MLVRRAASKIWENAGVPLTDAYTWGKVDVPSLHGRVVQVAAGNPVMGISPQSCHEHAMGISGFAQTAQSYTPLGIKAVLPQAAVLQAVLGIECVGHSTATVMQAHKLTEYVPLGDAVLQAILTQ